MKKLKHTIFLIVLSFTLISFKQINDNPGNHPENILISESKKIDINNISTWYTNYGSFNRDPLTGNSGFEWPKNSGKLARYASGMWIGGKVGSDTLIAIAEYSNEFKPGYIQNGIPLGESSPLYKIYSIFRGDTSSSDYMNWPANQGAYLDSQGKPFFLGTQTSFCSFTDGYVSAHTNRAGSTAPLKVDILQTNWAYTNVNLQDVIFTEYKIINKNTQAYTNAYISIWTDDDLGGAVDDAVGIDTVHKMGYTYNVNDNDPQYGAAPPAVGFTLLRSPVVPSTGDTVRYYNPPGSNNLVVKVNYKESGLSSFSMYSNGVAGASDPANYQETYNNFQGLKSNGTPFIDPNTNQVTKFPYSGDPVTNTGWVQTDGSDRRFLMTFGPMTINPNDTQSVIYAQVIARGSSNINSITKLRDLSNYVNGVYASNFQGVLSVNNISTEIPDSYKLSQNFPNPFNPSTVIRYSVTGNKYVSLKVYNALGNEVATLVNEKQNAGTYEVDFNGAGFSSGIYFYKFTADNFTDTKRMILLK
jgi:hypothetical protein